MYLKSLVLKGFKSFADRSVLVMEPGITAIVGPNGSGKSNISDAVLWVLGERSARNLRGQAMEDIIFAGSAARKAVSMAEVELVLDNSDRTLPVDYDEVSITRRMYRSGESEYLVNKTLVRRLDVMDILHDSGLGLGTHSIISQGNLDSILQSRPEDRRALIEEAAGVLKHKQRKERSARKLAAMDTHLVRVHDVVAEVSRQLGPLERKAKKARSYEAARAELSDVKLAIAVDDLRRLQAKWDSVCEAENVLLEELANKKGAIAEAEHESNAIQELMRHRAKYADALAQQQKRCSRSVERLDSCEMLVRTRRRSAQEYEVDLNLTIENGARRKNEAIEELARANEQLSTVRISREQAEGLVRSVSEELAVAQGKRKESEGSIASLLEQIRLCEREVEQAKTKQSLAQESLSSGLAHAKLVEARKAELAGALDRAREDQEQLSNAFKTVKQQLDELTAQDSQAQARLLETFEAMEDSRAQREQARQTASVLESERKAIEQAQRASRQDDPALLWLMDNMERFGGTPGPLSRVIQAPESIEALVENLLGEDLAALPFNDPAMAETAVRALKGESLAGDVSLVLPQSNASSAGSARDAHDGIALMDLVECPPASKDIIGALLGDVVVFDTFEEAFQAHARRNDGCRYVSRDGVVLFPNGKTKVFGVRNANDDGTLARERRLKDVTRRLGQAQDDLKASEANVEAAEADYRTAQAASLEISQKLASQKGACSSAAADEERARARLASLVRELEDIDAQIQAAHASVEDLRPTLDEAKSVIEQCAVRHDSLTEQRAALEDGIAPLRAEEQRLTAQLNEAKLETAKLAERETYSSRLAIARERDIQTAEESVHEARNTLAVKAASIKRADELAALMEKLSASLQWRVALVEEAIAASADEASSVNASAAQARGTVRRARDAFDETNARMTQVKIEKSRLEVQVEAAVNTVVRDCETPLDRAQDMPELQDRQAAEENLMKLERRIRNMGVISPDAAEEYEKVKARYDFLAGQLADMEAARRSLNRIVKVIDARMKDDFARTFETVNENFGEVFSLLFPGGKAELVLEDPTDLENTGVEVKAQPRGKRLSKMTLMSGGEKSLTALALLFAVYKTRTTPFYILDEVEAALDDTNLRRLVGYIQTLRETTQLIMITHQRRTMEMADVLFGVSMQADGITKVVSQKLERALEQAE